MGDERRCRAPAQTIGRFASRNNMGSIAAEPILGFPLRGDDLG